MTNKLIKNETDVFYTVRIKDGLFVKHADLHYGKVELTVATNNEKDAQRFNNTSVANNVALYVNGTITKHSRTTVVTEITEDFVPKGDVE